MAARGTLWGREELHANHGFRRGYVPSCLRRLFCYPGCVVSLVFGGLKVTELQVASLETDWKSQAIGRLTG